MVLLPLALISACRLALPAADAHADLYGDPLPPGASARLGTTRWRLDGPIKSVAFPPGGKTVVVAGDGTVRLWELATGRELRRLVCKRGGESSVRLLADGKTLEIWDGEMRLWDLEGWKELPKESSQKKPHPGFYYLAEDGKTLVVGDEKGGISLRDARTGRDRCRLEDCPRSMWGVQLSPDGKTAAMIDGRDALLWDGETGRKLHTLRAFQGLREVQNPYLFLSCFSLTFSPDSKKLATADNCRLVVVWDVATGKELHRLDARLKEKPGIPVRPVLFTQDGKTLVVPGNLAVYLCDAADGRLVRELPTRGYNVLSLGPDGKTLVVGGTLLRMLDLTSGKDTLPAFGGHEEDLRLLRFLPDGKTVLTVGADRTVRLWDAATGRQLRQFEAAPGLSQVALSPDGRLLVMGSWDGRKLAMGPWDGGVGLWDVVKGERLRRWNVDSLMLSAMALSPDGKMVATDGLDQAVHLWDVTTGTELRKTKPTQIGIYKIVFSPDGGWVAAAHEGFDGGGKWVIQLLDTATGEGVRRFQGWGERVQSLAFSPDGATLAAAGEGGTLRLLETATGRERARLPIPRGSINDIAFSPDGRRLALAQPGQPTHLWDMPSGKEVAAFDGGGGASLVAFAPDGRTLATAGDTSALLWPLGDADRPVPAEELSGDQRESAWEDLANAEAARAYLAVRALAADAGPSARFLQGRLEENAEAAARVLRLIARLDGDDFADREEAEAELRRLGRGAETGLRQTLRDSPSPEVRFRAERLTRLLKSEEALSPSDLRGLRALEALEHIGDAAALEALAARGKSWRLREDAVAALARMAIRAGGY